MPPIIKIAQFEGPYDLLLSLVDDKQMSISEISLSQVTEQFLLYLDTLEQTDPEELADFLVVATRLLLLKSRLLLPQLSPEEEDGPRLEDQLRLYKQFVEASKAINGMWENDRWGGYRTEPPRRPTQFVAPANLTLQHLRASMLQLVVRLTPPKALPQTRIDASVSLKQKIDELRTLLSKRKTFFFHEALSSAENKTEVIVGFLALLELVKGKIISLSQEQTFGDIVIERVS